MHILYQLSHKGSPRILEWVAYPFTADLPDPVFEPGSPALQVDSLPAEPQGGTWRFSSSSPGFPSSLNLNKLKEERSGHILSNSTLSLLRVYITMMSIIITEGICSARRATDMNCTTRLNNFKLPLTSLEINAYSRACPSCRRGTGLTA